MIEKLKPYAHYRATGVYWLPQVPSHWEIMRSKHVFAERTELARAGDVQLSATQAYGVIPQAEFERRVGRRVVRISMHLDKRNHVEKGDFVISMRSFQGGLERAWASGAIRSSYVVLRPARDLDLGYFAHLFKAQPYIKALQATGNFIRDGQDLTFGNFSRVDLPVPPHDEQVPISRFLDHANHRIDQFIRAKKKLIALLSEQKQAIIHRAVTRGLEANVRLKHSGIPWLGEIPAHWELTPNRAHLRVRKVLVGARHREYQLLSLTKRGVIIRDLSENKGKFSSDMGTSQEVRAGDLVFCLFDVPETPRTVGLSSHNGMITGAYTVMESRDPSIARFLEAFYIAMDDRKLLSPLYSGLRNTIPKDRFLGAKTPIPPAAERERILRFIAKETREIRAGIDQASAEIALVQEYRARLISDVVTGQLDVRTAAAAIADVGPEAERPASSGAELDDADDSDSVAA